ncbi:hypothetical protein [uncultured Imperialibacter sp.]|uniref:hypothetical protein n=1 Tax=Imperialibacter sp. TaxID=2038411 RepID=UPI0030DCE9CD|tara:strand:+ start:62 stop:568 length:507 start_codon:yes stop_codon:yes gene_type:complete
MKTQLFVYLTLVLLSYLSSCNTIPECGDAEIKIAAQEILIREITVGDAALKLLQDLRYDSKANYDAERIGANNYYENVKVEFRKKYADLNSLDSTLSENKHILDSYKVFKGLKEAKLANARTTAVYEELSKCECLAEVVAKSGKKIDITFAAQMNEDGEIYVEVAFAN